MHPPAIRVLVALAALAGCEPQESAGRPSRTRIQVDRAAQEAKQLDRLHRRVVGELALAQQRLGQHFEPPATRRAQPCPDSQLGGAGGPIELPVRVWDGRVQAKNLMPLEVTARLESDEFAAVVQHLRGGRAALWNAEAARPKDAQAGHAALAALARLRGKRYLGELRISQYSAPRLFIRKGALRREWHAGWVAFNVVVYDVAARRPLCHVPLITRGDASEAPIRRRLRERTRRQLQRALADRVWEQASQALGEISSRFRLPALERRTTPAHRWSAPSAAAAKASRDPRAS